MNFSGIEMFMNQNPVLFFLIIAWSMIWKGFALWYSSKRGEKWWFVAILLINTVGILEIIYLAFFNKGKDEHKESK